MNFKVHTCLAVTGPYQEQPEASGRMAFAMADLAMSDLPPTITGLPLPCVTLMHACNLIN